MDLLIEPINGPDAPGYFLSTQTQAHAMAHAGTTTVAATDGPHHGGDEHLHPRMTPRCVSQPWCPTWQHGFRRLLTLVYGGAPFRIGTGKASAVARPAV